MEESPKQNMTFRQAIAGYWQIPLFVLSMLLFVGLLIYLRPREVKQTFADRYKELELLVADKQFDQFYSQVELLRQECESYEQLGQIHRLAARARSQELEGRFEFGEDVRRTSHEKNYRNIISDTMEAFKFGAIDPNTLEAVPAFRDLGYAYWHLNETQKALVYIERALKVSQFKDMKLYRALVRMYLQARPKGYLDKCMGYLEEVLVCPEASADDRAWAFVRKAEVLIAQGKEEDALTMLNGVSDKVRESAYGDEVVFLRGRALHHAGQMDEADLILRNLIEKLKDRGDLYAQVALELGLINYEQYRDYDARDFFQRVVDTQTGNDWYAAGLLGLANCAALQQRYERSLGYYDEIVKELKYKPVNLAVSLEDVQQSLIIQSQHLSLYRQYERALSFLEIEQRMAEKNDVGAANRFARVHHRLAEQMQESLSQAKKAAEDAAPSELEAVWIEQQESVITQHFMQAADNYLRVAAHARGQDTLYGESLWQAAVCYDKAGAVDESVATWQRYVDEREGQQQWPRALYYLSQAYQSLGRFDEAISGYRQLLEKHPNAPAAMDSIVPLARCYLSQEPPVYDAAEETLIGALSNRAQTPKSAYFRQALFELGELYYSKKDFDQAIVRLTEAIDRYPGDESLGKYMFLVGDAYRQSGLSLDERLKNLANDPAQKVRQEQTSNLKRQRLDMAREYFKKAVAFYQQIPEGRRNELDQLYLKHCWLNRADCLFDLGQYQQAAIMYEEVALRYQLTPAALQAFVQIVNCHLRLGDPREAASANSRALWQLAKMPDGVLADSGTGLTRQQWEQWFGWTDQSGLW